MMLRGHGTVNKIAEQRLQNDVVCELCEKLQHQGNLQRKEVHVEIVNTSLYV